MIEIKEHQPSTIEEYEEVLKKHKKIISDQSEKIDFLYDQIGHRSKIIVSRLWENPEIKVEYNHLGIRIHMSAEDYIKSVINQITEDNHPKGWRKLINWNYPTKQQLQDMMLKVVSKIENEMKQSTIYFPPSAR